MIIKPIVSVCMITFNHENYIQEAIDGVLMQKCDFDIELVLSNDCSVDSTDTVIQNVLQNHPKASMIRYTNNEKNIGMMPNFIQALKQCNGEYISLCEGDDYWIDPLKLQKQVNFLGGNLNYTGCFHNTQIINEMESTPHLKPWRHYTNNVFKLKETLSITSLFHTSSFMFRTAALKIPHWFKDVQSGDMALFTIIASQGPLYRIDDNMSVYRKSENGITNTIKQVEYHANRIKLFEYFKLFLNGREDEQIKMVCDFHKKQLKKLKRISYLNRLKQIFKM